MHDAGANGIDIDIGEGGEPDADGVARIRCANGWEAWVDDRLLIAPLVDHRRRGGGFSLDDVQALSKGVEMRQEARDSERSLIARVFGRPSSRLGWVAAACMAASVGTVILLNVLAEQGSDDGPESRGIIFVGSVLCLFASGVLGLVAVFRKGERSLIVLLPAGLIGLAIANELTQRLLQLVGLGGGD